MRCTVSLPGNVGTTQMKVLVIVHVQLLSPSSKWYLRYLAPTETGHPSALQDGDADLDSYGLTISGTPVTSGETLVVSADVEIEINEAGLDTI